MRDIQEYQFVIPGACPPKGSRTPVGRGRATRESSKRAKPWIDVAREAMQDRYGKPWARFEGPVYVAPLFVFKRPKVTESEFPVAPSIGDLDKLVRCLLDALTQSQVIEDDRFVVELVGPMKIWGDSSHTVAAVGCVPHGAARRSMPDRLLNELTSTALLDYARFSCGVCEITEPHGHDRIDVGLPGRPEFIPGAPVFPNPYAQAALAQRRVDHHECLLVSMGCGEDDCPL